MNDAYYTCAQVAAGQVPNAPANTVFICSWAPAIPFLCVSCGVVLFIMYFVRMSAQIFPHERSRRDPFPPL